MKDNNKNKRPLVMRTLKTDRRRGSLKATLHNIINCTVIIPDTIKIDKRLKSANIGGNSRVFGKKRYVVE